MPIFDVGDVACEINSHLPLEMRVLGCIRVTKRFNAWKLCDKRRYEYCVPLWVLNRSSSQKDNCPQDSAEGKVVLSLCCHGV